MAPRRDGSRVVTIQNGRVTRRVLPRLRARHGLSDANDLPILGTLAAGQQPDALDSLITGDKDLLALSDHYPIVTPADFWARHSGLQSAPNATPPVYVPTSHTRPNVAVGLPLLPGGAGESGAKSLQIT